MAYTLETNQLDYVLYTSNFLRRNNSFEMIESAEKSTHTRRHKRHTKTVSEMAKRDRARDGKRVFLRLEFGSCLTWKYHWCIRSVFVEFPISRHACVHTISMWFCLCVCGAHRRRSVVRGEKVLCWTSGCLFMVSHNQKCYGYYEFCSLLILFLSFASGEDAWAGRRELL